MWNRALLRKILVRDGKVEDFTFEEPFASLLGSRKGSIVDLRGRWYEICVSSPPFRAVVSGR